MPGPGQGPTGKRALRVRAVAVRARVIAAPAPAARALVIAAPAQVARAPVTVASGPAAPVGATAVRAQEAQAVDTAGPLAAKAVRARGRIGATSLPGVQGRLPGDPGLLPGRSHQSARRRSSPLLGPAAASRQMAAGTGRRLGGTARRLRDAKARALAANPVPKDSPTPGLFRARSAARRRPAATCGPAHHAPRGRSIVGRYENSTT